MCRAIRPLFNFEPPVTDDEIRALSNQIITESARHFLGFFGKSLSSKPIQPQRRRTAMAATTAESRYCSRAVT